MDFTPDPNAMRNLEAMARPKLERACASLVTYIKTVKLSKGRRGQGDVLTEGEPPYAWSGSLRNAVGQRWKEGDPNTQQVGVFADRSAHAAVVGRVQELGANITGRGLLTIPRSDAAVRHLKGGGTTRNFPRPLTMIPSRRRSGVFFLVEQKRGGSKNPARTEIHFILARHVRIPPHPFIVPSLTEHAPQMIQVLGS